MAQTLKTWQFLLPLGITGALFTVSCASKASESKAPPAFPPTPVTVFEAKAQDVPIYAEYAAQTFARDTVDIRGRVDGYIEKRLFTVGSDVRAGQPLYILDRRPYLAEVAKAKGDLQQSLANLEFAKKQVAVAQAEADVAQAEANNLKAQNDVNRLTPLVKQEAAATQDLDNAQAALKANQANVNARKANLDQTRLQARTQIDAVAAQVEAQRALLQTAELNLSYATITSPISGRVGDSLIPVGGLVSKNAAQPLTTVVPLDPIWLRFKVSESEYLNTVKRAGTEVTKLPLELLLADGSTYPAHGRVQNTVNQVDPKTGTLELQATFPNPRRTLLPGQFGRIRFRADERHNAILVPQRAIQELQGLQSVYTVSPDNKAVARGVVMGDRVGPDQIVEQGLKPGDRVIVEGAMKVRPGAPVAPQPYQPARN
ncbi:MAG: efflux RND transporter periplasmic adaptor subunit [Acidobacteriota bacterium]|nr:efflux RND transporter periplasmic adaptor subunit [Acidobacteriota bacterium]